MDYIKKRINFDEIENETFKHNKTILYEIMYNEVKYEILINYKIFNNKAIIFGTGSVREKKVELPIFSRATWIDDFPCTTIFFFDPTLYLADLDLGWGYGTKDRWYLEEISIILNVILNKMKIQTHDTLYSGSSGGGFMAVMLATLMKSKATVINPQFFLQNYHGGVILRLIEVCNNGNKKLIPERINLIQLCKRENYFPTIHLLENSYSDDDIKKQLMPLLKNLNNNKINCQDKLKIEMYYNEKGHGGQPDKHVVIKTLLDDVGIRVPKNSKSNTINKIKNFINNVYSYIFKK